METTKLRLVRIENMSEVLVTVEINGCEELRIVHPKELEGYELVAPDPGPEIVRSLESQAICESELISMDPKTAERYDWDMAVANSRCPKCKSEGTEKMDAYPSIVCRKCGCMFDPWANIDLN